VVPVFVSSWLTADDRMFVRDRLLEIAKFGLAAVATFLVISPGTLLQPTLAVSGMRAQVLHYSSGHGIYTVGRSAEHLVKMLTYVLFVQPSPYVLVSAAFSVAAIGGAISLARRSTRTAVVVLSFPVLFVAYFAIQRVMIVRNLLVLAPFGAVLAAHGTDAAWHAVKSKAIARVCVIGAVGVVLAFDGAYQVAAVESIRTRGPRRTLSEFRSWLERQPADSVRVSGRLAQQMALGTGGADSSAADVAMYAVDAAAGGVRPNEFGTFERVFGPREVNLNYYPDWPGDDHIVVLSRRQVERLPLIRGSDGARRE
jgi:hypothetical protein